jgi:AraC-like DNA-binding protein
MITSIFFSYFFIFLLIGLTILINQKNINYIILGVLYLIEAYSSLLIFLLKSHLIFDAPSLYRTASPLKYLTGPLTYFFVLYSLNNSRRWSKNDLLHFIPFFLSIVSLIPTFQLSNDTKIFLLDALTFENFLEFPDGFLSLKASGILKYSILLIYSFFCIKLLLPFFKNKKNNLFLKNRLLLSWLLFDIILKFIIFLFTLYFVFIFNNKDYLYRNLSLLLFGSEMMISVFYLFLNPKLLLGVQWILTLEEKKYQIDNKIARLDNVKKKEELILTNLKEFMQLNEPYRKKVEVNYIAESLNISPVKLAAIIKKKYNQSFSDYINMYRLLDVDFQVSQERHLLYSFEHIAYDAGFNSKNAFYISFKKLRNSTPKKYYEGIKASV